MERRGSHRRSALSLAKRPFTPGFPSSGSDAAGALAQLRTRRQPSILGQERVRVWGWWWVGGWSFVSKRAHVSSPHPTPASPSPVG